MFSDHNGMKLEINSKRKLGKLVNMWELNNTLPVSQRRNQNGNQKTL